jgi:hypothetical protein
VALPRSAYAGGRAERQSSDRPLHLEVLVRLIRPLLALSAAALVASGLAVPSPAAAAVAWSPPTGRSDLRPFTGLGTWVDGFDWAREFDTTPAVTPRTTMFMQQRGVKTIYLQMAKDSPRVTTSLMSRDKLGPLIKAAHDRGIRVVGWYLPTFKDPAKDFRLLDAMLQFKYQGHHIDVIGLDLESTAVPTSVRNTRLAALMKRVAARTWLPVAAITLPPVLIEEINTTWWNPFPWKAIAPYTDVWIPMGYYTAYGRWPHWRNAATSTTEDIRRIRARVGSRVPVHYAGGLAGSSTATDYQRFESAARAEGAVGWSAYDWATTPGWAWEHLRP